MFADFFTKKQLIKTSILTGIAIVIEIIYFILDYFLHWNQEYALAGYIISVVFLLIGWVGANHIGYSFQRKEHNYKMLPLEIVNQKMNYRSPYIVAALTILAFSCVLELILFLVSRF